MEAYLLSALRTPYGAFGGGLSHCHLPDLSARLIPPLLGDAPPPDRILLASALPFDPASAARLCPRAGLPPLPPLLLQQGDAAGLWALRVALEALEAQQASRVLVLAGALPSSAPFHLPDARWGTRFGEVELRDPLLDLELSAPGQEPPPAVGLVPLDNLGKGKALHVDEPAGDRPQWLDGAAGFLLSRTALPDRPRVRLHLRHSPGAGEGSGMKHHSFPGGVGLAEVISAFHGGEASVCFCLTTLQETWTIRVTREAP